MQIQLLRQILYCYTITGWTTTRKKNGSASIGRFQLDELIGITSLRADITNLCGEIFAFDFSWLWSVARRLKLHLHDRLQFRNGLKLHFTDRNRLDMRLSSFRWNFCAIAQRGSRSWPNLLEIKPINLITTPSIENPSSTFYSHLLYSLIPKITYYTEGSLA